MELNCLIFWGILIPCLTVLACFLIVFCYKYRLKKMELDYKEKLEKKRMELTQAAQNNESLVEETKNQVFNSIKNEVKKSVEENFKVGRWKL